MIQSKKPGPIGKEELSDVDTQVKKKSLDEDTLRRYISNMLRDEEVDKRVPGVMKTVFSLDHKTKDGYPAKLSDYGYYDEKTGEIKSSSGASTASPGSTPVKSVPPSSAPPTPAPPPKTAHPKARSPSPKSPKARTPSPPAPAGPPAPAPPPKTEEERRKEERDERLKKYKEKQKEIEDEQKKLRKEKKKLRDDEIAHIMASNPQGIAVTLINGGVAGKKYTRLNGEYTDLNVQPEDIIRDRELQEKRQTKGNPNILHEGKKTNTEKSIGTIKKVGEDSRNLGEALKTIKSETDKKHAVVHNGYKGVSESKLKHALENPSEKMKKYRAKQNAIFKKI